MLLQSLVLAATLLTGSAQLGYHRIDVTKGISVILPVDAIEDVETAKKGEAFLPANSEMHRYISDQCYFAVGSQKFEGSAAETITSDRAIADSLYEFIESAGPFSIKKQRDILMNGWPGLDVVCVGKAIGATFRAFMVDKTLYLVAAVFQASKGRPKAADVFLDSLTLKPNPSSGPLKAPGPIFETFAPPGGTCSIGMPSKPKLSTEVDESGREPGFTRFEASFGNRVYIIGFADIPEQVPEDQAELIIMGQVIKAFEGTPLKYKKRIVRDKVPFDSQLFSFRPDHGLEGLGRADVAIVDHKAYTIVMIYPSGHAGSLDIDAFFNSFKLIRP